MKISRLHIVFALITLTLLSSFNYKSSHKEDVSFEAKAEGDTLRYIFLGHTYRWGSVPPNYKVDLRVEGLNYDNFDRIWLGGDILSEAMLNRHSMVYLDSIFNLGNPSTQYALGNHDIRNGNIQYYRTYTGRSSYNVFSDKGVVSICMNSQLNPSNCEDLNNQFDLIKSVCDTMQISSHLFITMHSCLFYGVPNIPNPATFGHTNFEHWSANCDSANTSFAEVIYPLLKQVNALGIKVYVIMGDTGSTVKAYHQVAEDSIHFFANGINNSKYTDPVELAAQPRDRVLIFDHVPSTQEVTWEFHELDSLFNAQ
jgi:hypothetical protein